MRGETNSSAHHQPPPPRLDVCRLILFSLCRAPSTTLSFRTVHHRKSFWCLDLDLDLGFPPKTKSTRRPHSRRRFTHVRARTTARMHHRLSSLSVASRWSCSGFASVCLPACLPFSLSISVRPSVVSTQPRMQGRVPEDPRGQQLLLRCPRRGVRGHQVLLKPSFPFVRLRLPVCFSSLSIWGFQYFRRAGWDDVFCSALSSFAWNRASFIRRKYRHLLYCASAPPRLFALDLGLAPPTGLGAWARFRLDPPNAS